MYDNLTKSDIKKMEEEIEYRKLVVRKEALEAVKEARAHGDLSENFEYKAAKQTYKLVTTVRGNSLQGLISIDSPLGKALKGHKAGDKVFVQVNDRFGYEIEIRSIDKTTEEKEDKLRSF